MDLTKIEYLGLDRVLKRGSGDILEQRADALLIRDRVSDALMLACEDASLGINLLDRHVTPDCDLLMVPETLGAATFERYGFTDKLDCWQVAYFGEKPAPDARLTLRPATASDLPRLTEHYHLLEPDVIQILIERESIFLGYEGERWVGFVGEHLEGSMGILYVLPEYRRRGFGAALETAMIARTMERGFVPFGQVVKDNQPSLRLQQKLGLAQSEHLIVWMWK